jgi:aromatic ring hydroxylase
MALRGGADYLAALRDGREVYLDGRRVEDVTVEPGLAAVAATFARIYDLAQTDQHRDALTFEDERGERVSGNWIQPRTPAELEWRRGLTQTVARHTGGLFGRAPDYVPLFHLGMLDIKDEFSRGDARFERNIVDYFTFARDNDLALAHAFVDVQAPADVPVEETAVPRVVETKEDGIVVRGVKTIATFAPFADELLVGAFPRPGLKDEHVLYFSLPIATPGLRVVARQPYGDGKPFDHPASVFGDENDSMVIFDDVLVPWERVFSEIGDVSFCARVFPRISEWAHWSILCRLAVKAEVLTGLYALIPELIGRAAQPQSQEALGEAIRYLVALRSFIYAGEARASVSASGLVMPDPVIVTAGRAYSVENYRRITGYLHDIASQGLINVPTEATLDNEVVGPALEDALSNSTGTARERARLLRLAWDMVCDSYGGRQTLFELFNALPFVAQRGQLVARFDTAPLKVLARATAGLGSVTEAEAAIASAERQRGPDYQAVGVAYTSYGGQRELDLAAKDDKELNRK